MNYDVSSYNEMYILGKVLINGNYFAIPMYIPLTALTTQGIYFRTGFNSNNYGDVNMQICISSNGITETFLDGDGSILTSSSTFYVWAR